MPVVKKPWWRRRWFVVTVTVVLVIVGGLAIAAEYALHHAAPILRKRVIAELSERFGVPVQLDSLDISLLQGVEVTGKGLSVPYGGTSSQQTMLLVIDRFSFRSSWRALLEPVTRVGVVYVDGMTIDLPPGQERGSILKTKQGGQKPTAKMPFAVDEIDCLHTKLIIENGHPEKAPRVFDIDSLVLRDVEAQQPSSYDAHLVNPIPHGSIHTVGHIGPWNMANPRETPLDGSYNFDHADMNTIKGLGGTLSSVGAFYGVLERITVDGTTDTPDFSLDISNHPMPLRTKFHAYVDGTSGDTDLEPVDAMLGETHILCSGKVVNLKGKGHDITLDAVIPRGRMADVLTLGMKDPKPIMHGDLTMKSKIHIPPGKVPVASKVEIAGQLQIHHLSFTNPAVQNKLDGLSMRAQGKPQESGAAGSDKTIEAYSQLATNFALKHGQMTFDSIIFDLPGAHIRMAGIYDMHGDAFDFKGRVRTDATASQMVTGWKSWLLKPADRFLKKNGAGVELPISISGVKNDVHFGLAFNHADDTPAQIRDEMQQKREAGKLGHPR